MTDTTTDLPDLTDDEIREAKYEQALSIIQARVDHGLLILLPGGGIIEADRHPQQTLKALSIALGREVKAISAEPDLIRCGHTRYRVVEIPKGVNRAKFEQYLDYMLDGLVNHTG
jgi:hypothetical protein